MTTNRRVTAALREGHEIPVEPVQAISERLPTIPEPLTSESAVEWIEQAIEVMAPESNYRKELRSILERYRFRKLRDEQTSAE